MAKFTRQFCVICTSKKSVFCPLALLVDLKQQLCRGFGKIGYFCHYCSVWPVPCHSFAEIFIYFRVTLLTRFYKICYNTLVCVCRLAGKCERVFYAGRCEP